MYTYRSELDRNTPAGRYVDIWSGFLYKELKARGHFVNPQDIGFGLATDAYSAFSSVEFSVWPILAINYSIPPQHRHKLWNLSVVGLVPGPKQPKRVDTFFLPLIKEFNRLTRTGMLKNPLSHYSAISCKDSCARSGSLGRWPE